MADINDLKRAFQNLFDAKQTVVRRWNALAGDGAGTFKVTDDPDFAWVRYITDQSRASKVLNPENLVIPEDTPLIIGKRFPESEYEEILGVDVTLYRWTMSEGATQSYGKGKHGDDHNAASGTDPASIDLRNLVEMRMRPQATPDLTVFVERGQYQYGDTVKRFPSASIDLSGSVPAAVGHRYVLVYVDGATNALGSLDGTIVPIAATPPIPDVPGNTISGGLVELTNGQTTITEDDCFDWRFLWELYSNKAPDLIGTDAERLALTIGNLAELTRFHTTDTDKTWQVWEGAWRIIYPPAALASSDGDATNPWTTNAAGVLTGSQDLVLDNGVADAPGIVWIGGANNEQIQFILLEIGVGSTRLNLDLADNDGDSELRIADSSGNEKFQFNSDGESIQTQSEALTNTVATFLTWKHETSGTAAAGFGSRWLVQLEDAGGAMEDCAAITFEWEDAAAASEDTIIRFWLRKGGVAMGPFIEFGATEVVFNESSADIDFRVETDGATHALFVNGGTNRVGINESSPNAVLHVTSTAAVPPAIFERSGAGTAVPSNRFYNPDTTDGNGTVIAFFSDTNGAGGAAAQNLANVGALFNKHDHATRQSSLVFRTSNSGAVTTRVTIAPNGDVTPGTAKGQDLGSAAAEWDVIYYVTATTGTSRLVDSTRTCPVCATQMVRGTGTVNFQGEDADYALVFCLNCGNVGIEEWRHLPPERLSERLPAPMIVFEGMRVKSHGRSRTIAVDFRYSDDEDAIRNSTVLSDAELAAFMAMTARDRDTFLTALGQREWDAREEQRIMRSERDILQSQLDALNAVSIGTDLASRKE